MEVIIQLLKMHYLVKKCQIGKVKRKFCSVKTMARYDPEWDRVVRAIQTHYGMYDKVEEINIRQGVESLERNWQV